jgi:plasmid maintenance system antidote protein VapI
VFSWVAVRLDQPDNRKDQVWLDLRAEMDWAEAELRNRIFLVCQAPTSDPST